MLFLRSSWRFLALSAVLGGLSLLMACKGNSDGVVPPPKPTYTISGTIKYTRVPLVKDANGVPLGLETDPAKFTEHPARGLFVRALKGKTQTDASGASVVVWSVAASTGTDNDGKYKLTVEGESPVFIEVIASLQSSGASPIRIIASDIASSMSIVDRPVYSLRKGADGSAPAGNPTPGTVVTADAAVDFNIGTTTSWWKAPIWPSSATQGVLESSPSGGRVVSILEAAVTFSEAFGDPTPGNTLDLHYVPGTSWSHGGRPSFTELDARTYPASFDGSSFHYFGAIRAASGIDDAWNQSALYEMYARNLLFRLGCTQIHPTVSLPDRSDLQDMAPDMALFEGFATAMAAVVQKSPYLTTALTPSATVRDLRVRSGLGNDLYSAAVIAGLGWEIALRASSQPTPGTPTDWAKLDPIGVARFFVPFVAKDDAGNPKDNLNLYNQIARLQATRAAGETVDLAAIFTDTVLTSMTTPFGVTWPRPTTGEGASYLLDWGKDPDSKVLTSAPAPFTLSMAKAHLNGLGVYPNQSKGEVVYARFLLTKDRKYRLTVQTPGGIPVGATIEVAIGGVAYAFTATETTVPDFTLYGNPTTPKYQGVRIRLLSPSVIQPDLPITVRLDALN